MPLTPAERLAIGRAARKTAPRSAHANWDPPHDRADPVSILQSQAAQRVPELLPIRYGRMLASEFSFYRGAAAIMAADLADMPHSGLRVQLCGDAHVGNFGGFHSPERTLVFDINDFDETLPGPWEWDVKRLATSLAVAGRERGFPLGQRRSIVADAVGQYRRAMARFAAQRHLDVWYARLDATSIMRRWHSAVQQKSVRTRWRRTTSRARLRDSLGAFDKLTHVVDGQPRIVSRPPLLVPVEELAGGDVAAAEDAFNAALRKYRSSLPRDRRHLLERFHYVHFARKVVGIGSVGSRSWIVLLMGRDGTDPLILQFKEAQESVLAPYAGRSRFSNEGQRVVEGQRLLQASSDIFLGWVRTTTLDGTARNFYARQLWDGKISADIERMPPSSLGVFGEMCGWTLARAHARSGDRIAIAAYLGGSTRFDLAIVDFAEAYADQNSRDHAALAAAVDGGRVEAVFDI